MDTMHHAIAFKDKEYSQGDEQVYSFDNQKMIIELIMTFVYQNKDDFILLLFRSKGSTYEAFKENIKHMYADIMMSWLSLVAKEKQVSRFFVESIADFYINTISQMILKDLSQHQIKQYFDELLSFVHGGWEKILNYRGKYE